MPMTTEQREAALRAREQAAPTPWRVYFQNNIIADVHAATEAEARELGEREVNAGCDEFWRAERAVPLRETVDGFGIRTTLVDGEAVLRQAAPGQLTNTLSYESPAAAREAFEYVASRAHYGRF